MTALITATLDPTNLPPRVQLDVTGSPGVTVTITRTDPDGGTRPVRTAESAQLVSGAFTCYDYESPFDPGGNARITYSAQPSGGSAAFTTTVAALQITQAWLIHPGVPDLSQPINGTSLSTVTSMSGATLHNVPGRSNPVPVSDGVRKGATFNLLLKTTATAGTSPIFPSSSIFPDTSLFPSGTVFPDGPLGPWVSSTAALYDLLADTAPLLLQLVYPYTTAVEYKWINVGQVTEDRRSNDFGDPRRIMTLECAEVDRPAGGIASQRTWADLLAECSTWRDVLNRYATWHGVLTGVVGT